MNQGDKQYPSFILVQGGTNGCLIVLPREVYGEKEGSLSYRLDNNCLHAFYTPQNKE